MQNNYRLGCSNISSNGTVKKLQGRSLEVLLSSPICWKKEKSCDFFTAAHNYIKDKDDVEITEFKARLESSAKSSEWKLWGPHGNWDNVLGDEHFKLLTVFQKVVEEKGNDDNAVSRAQVKTWQMTVKDNTSVLELLRQIRNRVEHNELFQEDEKKKLTWFRKIKRKWKFDSKLYAMYWQKKFPRLEYFLWSHFFEHRAYLQEFYGCHVQLDHDDLVEFPFLVNMALERHLGQGGVGARYIAGDAWTLEFRTDFSGSLHKLLCGSSTLEIKFTADRVTCTWSDKGCSSEKKESRLFSTKSKESAVFIGSILIANRIADVESKLQDLFRKPGGKSCINCDSRLVIFSQVEGKVAIEKLVQDIENVIGVPLTESPVTWLEIGECYRDKVLKVVKCNLQCQQISMQDLLPQDKEIREEILCKASGKFLNKLLREEVTDLLGNSEWGRVSDIYIKRDLYNCDKLSSIIFQYCSKSDVFLVTEASFDDLQFVLKARPGTISFIDNDTDFSKTNFSGMKQRIFLVQRQDIKHLGKAIYLFLRNKFLQDDSFDIRVHCLRCINRHTFQWLETHGWFPFIEPLFNASSKQAGMISEENLIDTVATFGCQQRMIFIADSPGMGKSQVLLSIARKLLEKYSDRFVMCFDMSEFVENLKRKSGNKIIGQEDVVSTITDLSCSTEFECSLVRYWLEKECSNAKTLEIMLDGLDEVSLRLRSLAMDALKVIRDQLPTARAWVTLRDHMMADVRRNFGTLGFKLVPFSRKCQIQYLKSYWWNSIKSNDSCDLSQNAVTMKKFLRAFAKMCVKSVHSGRNAEIAGIPLQCRLIAEINEWKIMKFISGEWTVKKEAVYSTVSLYEKMLARKLEIYLKEKNAIAVEISHPILNAFREEMERHHVYFSLRIIFSEDVANSFRKQLLIPDESNRQFVSTVLAVGLVQKILPLSFIHRTFAEFIIARFVYKVITDQCLYVSKGDQNFQNLLWNVVLDVTFYDDFIDLFASRSELRYPAVVRFLNDILEENQKAISVQESSKYLANVIRDELEYNIHFAEEVPLFTAAIQFGYENILSLLLNSKERMLELLNAALECQAWHLCKYLIQNESQFTPENWHKLPELDENKYGILHVIMKGILQYPVDFKFEQDCSSNSDNSDVLGNDEDYFDARHENEVEMTKEFIKFVIGKDKSVLEARDAKGKTPLLLLLHLGSRVLIGAEFDRNLMVWITFLVTQMGANVHATDNEGNTVLHISHECNPDLESVICCTPVYQSKMRWQYSEIWEFFMQNGCDKSTLNSRNNKGHTPLFGAVVLIRDFLSLQLNLFKTYGADFNVKDELGNTVLHISVENGYHWQFIRDLILSGADISALNAKGQTALHLAVQMNNIEVAKLLVEKFNADTDSIDWDGRRVVDYASSEEIEKYVSNYSAKRKFYKRVNTVIISALLLSAGFILLARNRTWKSIKI